jgi:hypothetical protein
MATRDVGIAVGAGLIASAALTLALLDVIPREMLATPAPWLKVGYAGSLALAGAWLTARLSRPVARLTAPAECMAAIVGAMALVAGVAWFVTPAAERAAMLFGRSWISCPWKILLMSLPALAGSLWVLRGSAPVRPRAAGLSAGLLAGAIGALGYSMACTEMSVVFVAVWYSIGIALAGGLGAILGARFLEW